MSLKNPAGFVKKLPLEILLAYERNENFSFDSVFTVDEVQLSNDVITRKFQSTDLNYDLTTTSLGISYNC